MSLDFSLAECENLANETEKAYEDFLNKLNQDDLASLVTYKNSKGTEFSTSVGDILTHVSLHGTYHKVEAIEFVPGANGGMAFGTDDENLGASVYLDWNF